MQIKSLPAVAPVRPQGHSQSGNVIFYVLLSIVLLGLLTAALRNSGIEGTSIDKETMTISVTRLKDQANALERGVAFIIQNGASENDIRFPIRMPMPVTAILITARVFSYFPARAAGLSICRRHRASMMAARGSSTAIPTRRKSAPTRRI